MSSFVYKRLVALAISAFALLLTSTVSVNADESTIAYGGKLYDNWIKITGERPKGTHSAWPESNTKKKGSTTHRCKSCHGWDYLGKDGAYATGKYQTGITGVRAHDGGDPAAVVDIIKDNTHGFGDMLKGSDMMAIAMFVTQGQVDMDMHIDRASNKFKGDAAKGKDYYDTICINCHGSDGRLPKDMPALGGLSLKNPWETVHKILNGQPSEGMPGLRALPIDVTMDIGTYLQTLPKE